MTKKSSTWRLAVLLMIAARAWGCSCSGDWPSAKQAWQRAPYVFLGTVELADPDKNGLETMFQNQFVRIRVDEPFKGVFRGQTIEMHQGASDCDAKFRTGAARAVFYLSRLVGVWMRSFARQCGARRRRYAVSARPAEVRRRNQAFGQKSNCPPEDSAAQAFRRKGGVPNVKVMISGSGGFARELLTNAAGGYRNLPQSGAGNLFREYRSCPKASKIKFPVVTGSTRVRGDEAAVELTSNSGASVSFVLRADTRLSGRMLDARGEPIKDVCIDLRTSPKGRGDNGALFFDCSKNGEKFSMEMMPPGKYLLVARDQLKVGSLVSESTLYYPGVRAREHAAGDHD